MREAPLRPPSLNPGSIAASGLCIGCGACAGLQSPDEAVMAWDGYGELKPRAASDRPSAGSRMFAAICPFSPEARDETAIAAAAFPDAAIDHPLVGRFEAAYVGHAEEDGFRLSGSSGGMVSWVAAELVRRKLVDGIAHVAPLDGTGGPLFGYRVSRTIDEVRRGAKSRYHPVHLADVLREIRARPGRYAIVGVPCFVKAIRLLGTQDPVLRKRIPFTLGLFCGHMKSSRFVDSFAWQMGVSRDAVARVEYRLKNPDRPANWYTAHLTLADGRAVWKDWWHLADGDWGAGFFQNAACNYCDDVVAETADIAFGDAWVEPYSSDGRGTNVVIVRSPLFHRMVETARQEGRLTLQPVDADFIVATQEAGLRHRREGLAYRLTWSKRGILPRKRVFPSRAGITARRRLVYRMRAIIAKWSHRVAWLARRLDIPGLYVRWARLMLAAYQALTYSRGSIGRACDAIERLLARVGR